MVLDRHTSDVRTSVMDEKCQAFGVLIVYGSAIGPRFALYLPQVRDVPSAVPVVLLSRRRAWSMQDVCFSDFTSPYPI